MASPNKKSVWAQVGAYLSLGFFLPAASVAGYLIGVGLDRLFDTTFLKIVFLIVGIAAGFVEMIRIVSRNSP